MAEQKPKYPPTGGRIKRSATWLKFFIHHLNLSLLMPLLLRILIACSICNHGFDCPTISNNQHSWKIDNPKAHTVTINIYCNEGINLNMTVPEVKSDKDDNCIIDCGETTVNIVYKFEYRRTKYRCISRSWRIIRYKDGKYRLLKCTPRKSFLRDYTLKT